uniref:Polysaccharide biosynthesis protein n=1 Tax=Hydrogenovibrio crunogenus (strain DSM 25203 / XCL-2) TaxID=317025 RepID=Q31EZ6_HYDCU
MNRYIKNILAAFSIAIQVLVILLLFFFHGANSDTDNLFLALAVLTVLQLLILMSFDQFVVFFNRIKTTYGYSKAQSFYYNVLIIALITSLVLCVLSIGAIDFFRSVSGLFGERTQAFLESNVLNSFLIALPAYGLIALNDRYYNALGQIVKSYFLVLIPNLSIFLGVLMWSFEIINGIGDVGKVYSITMWLGALTTTYLILNKEKSELKCVNCELRRFMVNSFIMRLGHNLYAISFQLVTNFILLGMTEGILSIFNYAYRAVLALFTVSVGPSNRVFMYELAQQASNNELHEYKSFVKPYLKEAITLFFILNIILIMTIFTLNFLNGIYDVIKINFDLNIFIVLLVIIASWQAIVILESVYVGLIITATEAKVFLIANSIFSAVYFSLAYSLSSFNDVLVFSLAGFLSQLISYFIYKYYSSLVLIRQEENNVSRL